LSTHKSDLLETIKKSKEYHPNITKIIFYTHQEWGQGKKNSKTKIDNDSTAKTEVEKTAKTLNIEIEWRCASYFDSEFVCIENENIARHFFSLEKSIIDLIKLQKKHTDNILSLIHIQIIFNNIAIEIERDSILSELKNANQQVFILSGAAGTGKTAIIKKLHTELKDNIAFYIFKATKFELRNIRVVFTVNYYFSIAYVDNFGCVGVKT
jgi:flagellar biosynthesis GTPase FlhF